MSGIDIRRDAEIVVDKIIFSNVGATHVYKDGYPGVRIMDDNDDYVIVNDEIHCTHLIEALMKARELGWFDE